MADFNFKALSENLVPATDSAGTLSFTDKGNLYLYKSDGSKLKITDVYFDIPVNGEENKLYIDKANKKIQIWNGIGYEDLITPSGGIVNNIDDSLSTSTIKTFSIDKIISLLSNKADSNTIPVNTSDLNNDSGYITSDDIPVSYNANSINLDTTTFDKNLDNSVTNIQILAEKVDELTVGGNFSGNASDIPYDNTLTRLTATNTQSAIDEIDNKIELLSGNIGSKTVDLQGLQDGQIVAYSSALDKFIPQDLPSGALLNVRSLGMIINDGATQATISFINPASANITSISLFISYSEDLVNRDFAYCSANATLLSNTFTTTSGATNTHNLPITDTNRGQVAYVRVFVNYSGDYSSGSGINQLLKDITPTNPITNFQAVQNTDNTVKLSWDLPINTDLASVIIKMKVDSQVTDRFDGDKIYEGLNTTFTTTVLDKTKHYYFRAFTIDRSGNYQEDVSQSIDIQMDNTPPSDVGLITKSELSKSIKVSWQTNDNADGDWEGIRLVIKQGTTYPINITDGTYIDIFDINTLTYTFGGLLDDQIYSIQLFPFDKYGNYNTNIINRIQGTPFTSPLSDLASFTATNTNNGTQVKLSYTVNFAPQGTTYQSTKIYASKTVNLDNINATDIASTPNVYLLTTDTVTTQGNIGTYYHTSNNVNIPFALNDTINYKAFMVYTTGASSGVAISSFKVLDTDPPSNVTSLTLLGDDGSISIKYTDPNESDWQSSTILVTTNGYKTDDTYTGVDLVNKTVSTVRNEYQNTPLTVNGLANGTIYYVQIFPKDTNGNVNKNSANRGTVSPQTLQAYTIEWDSTTDVYTKKNLADGKTTSEILAQPPYSLIKRCIVNDALSTVTYLKATDSNYKEDNTSATLDGSAGQVMVEVSKFWYKTNYASGKFAYSVSSTALTGFSVHPMFIHGGVTYDKVYIGAFEGYKNGTTNKMESRNGVTPTTGLDVTNMRNLAVSRGSNWGLLDENTLDGVRILSLIAYGTFNIQSALGLGIVNDTAIHNTGETLLLGNSSGNTSGLNDGKHAVSLFGIENFYGNIHKFIDGIVVSDTKLYTTDTNYGSFVSEANTGTYAFVSDYTPTTLNGFISNLQYLSGKPHLFIANEFNGSDTTKLSDYQYSLDGTGFGLMYLGYKYDGGTKAGLYASQFVNTANNTKAINSTNLGVLGTGSQYKFTFNKTTDGMMGAKAFQSTTVDDSGASPVLNISYSLNNVGCRLMAWK